MEVKEEREENLGQATLATLLFLGGLTVIWLVVDAVRQVTN